MIQKKICLLGAFSVGKTSLIRRFVSSLFDEKYLTTIGVKVDKKVITASRGETKLMIWDLAGEDDYHSINTSYLRGASGYILVVDGTRPATLQTAREVHEMAQSVLGKVPAVLAANKADLKADWRGVDEGLQKFDPLVTQFETSAKSGDKVDQLFLELVERMLSEGTT